jgi:hypothetical protein
MVKAGSTFIPGCDRNRCSSWPDNRASIHFTEVQALFATETKRMRCRGST